jgi:WD40 repeat protein/serine/threonine protein kinase
MPGQTSTPTLLERLRQCQLLEADQLEQLATLPEAHDPDPRALGRILLQRRLLTRYQINLIAQGRSRELQIGPYRILDRLGEGGMGQVFKAQHQHMNRIVALKVIRKERLGSPDAVKRFYKEVQAAAALTHPNIVLAYDANQEGNTHYFSMEYIEGTDLSRLIKDSGPLQVAQACDFIRQAALGLQHAHERGLTHRDIKPANLLVSNGADGKPTVKILDMGLTRLTTAADQREKGLTQTGQVVGHPDFLAPEQAVDSRSADIRSDLYSLGCTLYFLLTGQPPFTAQTLTQVLLQHQMEEAPPIRKRRPEVPSGVDAIVRKLMAKSPADRFQTPAELAEVLEPFSHGENVPDVFKPSPSRTGEASKSSTSWDTLVEVDPRTVQKPRRRREEDDATDVAERSGVRRRRKKRRREKECLSPALYALIGVGVAVPLLVVLLIIGQRVFKSRKPEPNVAEGPPAAFVPTNPSVEGPGARNPAIPEGASAPDRPADNGPKPGPNPEPKPPAKEEEPEEVAAEDVVLRALDPSRVKLIALTGHARRPFGAAFSPDDRLAASCGEHGELVLWEVATGKLLHSFERMPLHALGVAFSPDGQRVIASCFEDVRHYSLKDHRLLKTVPGGGISLSCDGRTCIKTGPLGGKMLMRVFNPENGSERGRIPPVENLSTTRLSISANNKRLMPLGGKQILQICDAERGREVRRLQMQTIRGISVGCSPDGLRALIGCEDGLLRLWDVEADRELAQFSGKHGAGVCSIVYAEHGAWAVSTGLEGSVCLWDVSSGQALWSMQANREPIGPVALSHDGRRVLLGRDDGRLQMLDFSACLPRVNKRTEAPPKPVEPTVAGQALACIRGHTGAISSVAVDSSETKVYSASADGSVRMWGLRGLKGVYEIETLRGHRGAVTSLSVGTEYSKFITAGNDGTLRRWDLNTEKKSVPLSVHPGKAVLTVALTSDGRRALCGGRKKCLELWDLDHNNSLSHLEYDADVLVASYSRDGQRAVVGVGTKVLLYDMSGPGPRLLRSLRTHTKPVVAAALSPDGTRVITGDGNVVRLWSAESGNEIRSFQGHTGQVRCVTFSVDGQHALSGSEDRTVRLWDLDSGREVSHCEGHQDAVSCVSFVGTQEAVSGSLDRTVRHWRLLP